MTATALQEIEITSRSRRFPAYPASRRSRIWGVSSIPDHWQEKPLKSVAAINTDKLSEATDPDHEIEYVDIGNVNLEAGVTSTERYRFENAPSRARRKVRHGDTIVSTVRTYLKAVAYIVNPPENLIVSTGFAVLRANPSLDPGFLYRLAQSEPLIERVMAHSVGVSYPAINASDIGKFPIPLPTLDEQRAIAAFLDRETARIDELIAKKQRLIELLKEKRQAVISRAVTKGLNPNVPMKPSGIDWLGDIPEHWQIQRLRFLFDSLNHRRIPLSGEDRSYREKIYPYYGASGIIDAVDEYIFDEPLILVAEDGANLLSRSTTLAFVAEGKYWVNNHAHIIRPKAGPIRYWEALLQTFDFTPLVSGSAQPKLTIGNLNTIALPVPPVSEQEQIAEVVVGQGAEINAVIDAIANASLLLSAYRSALITAAVTGQIDVRNHRAEEPT